MATQRQVEAGRKGREASLKFENEFVEDVQKEFGPRAAIMAAESTEGKNVNYPSTISEKTGHKSKPDVLVFYNGLSDFMPAARELQKIYDSEVGIKPKKRCFSKSPELLYVLQNRENWSAPSLKNPKDGTTEIQMQVTSLSNLFAALAGRFRTPISMDAYRALELWIGVGKTPKSDGAQILVEDHRKQCENNLVDYDRLTSEERRRGRLCSSTLPSDKFDSLVDLLSNNKDFLHALATVVFSEGITKLKEIERHPELRADFMVWKPKDSSKYTVFFIEDVVNAVVRSEPVINETTVYLGPLQFQKKGSGAGSAYNNIQFNASLDGRKAGLLRYVTPVAVCDSAEEAYLKMKEHAQGFGRWSELSRKMELHRQSRPKTNAEKLHKRSKELKRKYYEALKVRA